MQYSITNLNAFIILVTIGFSLYPFVNKGPLKDQYEKLLDINNSPIQLISQLKGYFYINPVLALSLAITLFSFVGIPPLIGFFAKQMVLSAALDSGFVFLALIAILTSVISAVYYLSVIKQVFFDEHEYKLNPYLVRNMRSNNINKQGNIGLNNDNETEIETETDADADVHTYTNTDIHDISLKLNSITLSSCLTVTVSTLTLILLSFIFWGKT